MDMTTPLRLPFRSLPFVLATGCILSAQAQSPCDDLAIDAVLYGAFDDTTIMVDVTNTSPDLIFGYPRFLLIDTGGDTLTEETLNFFGIGSGGQTHRMDLRPGQVMPNTPFTGTLVLTYMDGVNPDPTCTFALTDHALCPPPPCAPIALFLQASAFPTVDAAFTWYLSDVDGNTVTEGQFTIDAEGSGSDIQEICLPPGDFTLHVARPFGTEGQFVFGASRNGYVTGPITPFIQQGNPAITTDLPFRFFPLCLESANSMQEVHPEGPSVVVTGDGLRITATDGQALGALQVMDMAGRPVRRLDVRASSATVPLSGLARGAYLLRSIGGGQPFPTQRFVIP